MVKGLTKSDYFTFSNSKPRPSISVRQAERMMKKCPPSPVSKTKWTEELSRDFKSKLRKIKEDHEISFAQQKTPPPSTPCAPPTLSESR